MQEKFLEAIFYAYFTKGRNISDFDTLAELAEEVGVLSKDQVCFPGWRQLLAK